MKRLTAIGLLCAVLCCGCAQTSTPAATQSTTTTGSTVTTTAAAPIVDTGTIVGKWENTADLAGGLINTFINEQVAYYYEGQSLDFVMTVTFGEDGTYRSELNVEKSRDAYEAFIELWYEMTEQYYADLIEYNKVDVTVDEMIADFEEYYGKSMREMFREQVGLEALAERFAVSGTYRVDGAKLYRGANESVYETYLLEDGALYIVSSSDPNLSEEDKAGYPYKFVRVG